MKKISLYLVAMICTIGIFSLNVAAQTKKKKAKPTIHNTARGKKKPATSVTTPQPDSIPTVAVADTLGIKLAKVPSTLRANTSAKPTVDPNVKRNEKTPLAYENLRVDDELYKQTIWRNINTKEKMNLPFGYEADEDNGNQRFISIILKTLKDGINDNDSSILTVFNGLDDRFTTPMKLSEITQQLVGTPYVIQVHDWVKDPTGTKEEVTKDSLISEEFNPATIETYQIKEEVIFDRKTSRLHFRILGIAPMKKTLDANGNSRGEYPLFWIYYPDFRPVLANYEAYNPRNGANRLSWEEVFENRYFSSYIVKSTIANNSNQYLSSTIKDPILRLVESDNIKDQIFNFEQNQWSY